MAMLHASFFSPSFSCILPTGNLLPDESQSVVNTSEDNVVAFIEQFLFSKVNYIIPAYNSIYLAAYASHATLCPVAPDGISLFFPRYKSNTTRLAVLLFVSQHY